MFKVGTMTNHQKLFKDVSILLVEDNERIRQEIAQLLRIFFRVVWTAKDGKEGLECYEDEKPDFILSDIKMPLVDGISLVRSIRQKDFQTPIVLLSSYCDQSMLLDAANSGIDGYIVKPVVLEQLLETFTKLLPKITPKKELITLAPTLVYNTFSEELFKEGVLIPLGTKEKALLKLFLNHKEKVIGKEQIVFTIWGMEEVTDSALKNLLARVRQKVGFELIVSVKGSGWRLNS